ncbi:MAG: fasciclin domain-containing protein [Trueperaceae bacterium]|nr:fasciclin domain-containing protein [Trueperaceae bacterium]
MIQRALRSLTACLALAFAWTVPALAQSGPDDLASAIRDHPDLTVLADLLEDSGMMDDLEGGMRLTVFAPSDRAFERLDPEVRRILLRDRGALDLILRHHIIAGAAPRAALRRMDAVTTLEATRLSLRVEGDEVRVDGTRLREGGTRAGSGMLYVVDRVLVPQRATSLKALLTGPRSN